jgi:DNA-directed RNA polymerase specialized sigma24 family protein
MAGDTAALYGAVRKLFESGPVFGLGESQLLRRFVETGDEQAFAALVARHGPMVFGVCRRALGQRADAEDAFQATFFILARKAASVRDGDRLGPWLYGVARRVAARTRATAKRRDEVEGFPDTRGIVAFPPGIKTGGCLTTLTLEKLSGVSGAISRRAHRWQ